MSSKVLSGDCAKPAEPLVWRAVGPSGSLAPMGAAGASVAALAQLQVRLAEVEQQARQREQEAHQAGLRQGRAAGAEEAAANLGPLVERLGRVVEEISEQRRRFRREAEEDVVRLAVAIARRILHRELHTDPEALLGVVNAALKKIEASEVNRLRVHPAEVEVIRTHLPPSGRLTQLEVVADPALERGAVVFETARGSLDASVDTQLEEIQRGLSDLLHGGR